MGFRKTSYELLTIIPTVFMPIMQKIIKFLVSLMMQRFRFYRKKFLRNFPTQSISANILKQTHKQSTHVSNVIELYWYVIYAISCRVYYRSTFLPLHQPLSTKIINMLGMEPVSLKLITTVIYSFRNKLECLSLNTRQGWKGLPGTNTLGYYGNSKLRS